MRKILSLGFLTVLLLFFSYSPTAFATTTTGGSSLQFIKKLVDPAALVRAIGQGQYIQGGQWYRGGNVVRHELSSINSMLALRDKFVIDSACGYGIPSLWVAKEDGSLMSSRNSFCNDDADGVLSAPQIGATSKSLSAVWGSNGDAFIEHVMGQGEMKSATCVETGTNYWGAEYCTKSQGIDRSVYYELDGIEAEPVSDSPDSEGTPGHRPSTYIFNVGVKVLTDKVLTSDGGIFSLPEWKRTGKADSAGKDGTVSLGDFVISLSGTTRDAWKVSGTSAKKLTPLFESKYGQGGFAYDNSTWPPKIALSYPDDPAKVRIGSYQRFPVTFNVYKISNDNLILDKKLKVPQCTFTCLSPETNKIAIWKDYIVFASGMEPENKSKFEVWNGVTGIKVASAALPEIEVYDAFDNEKVTKAKTVPVYFAISQNGYVAVQTERGGNNEVYLYKLNITGTGSTSDTGSNNTDTGTGTITSTKCQNKNATNYGGELPCIFPAISNPGKGECSATISFDKTSIPWQGTAVESWEITGADPGQTFGDCGAGITQITPGPRSYTFEKLENTTTCKVWGNINGAKKCEASATVNVEPAPVKAKTTFQVGASASVTAKTSENVTLRQGSSGLRVRAVQEFLNDKQNAGLKVDGSFGAKTKSAVMKWQTENGLVADGLVGPKTAAAMGL